MNEDMMKTSSPLGQEIERIIMKDVARFIERRDAGSSGSMNGALDYTSTRIIEAMRHHMGLPPLTSYQPT